MTFDEAMASARWNGWSLWLTACWVLGPLAILACTAIRNAPFRHVAKVFVAVAFLIGALDLSGREISCKSSLQNPLGRIRPISAAFAASDSAQNTSSIPSLRLPGIRSPISAGSSVVGFATSSKWQLRQEWAQAHEAELTEAQRMRVTADGANLLLGPVITGGGVAVTLTVLSLVLSRIVLFERARTAERSAQEAT